MSPPPLTPGKLWGMRRMADTQGRFKMVAVDQRPPFKNLIKDVRGTDEAPYGDVAGFTAMMCEDLCSRSTAMLVDPHYAYPVGMRFFDPARGLILTLEDSLFTEGEGGGRLSVEIDNWSVEKIKRAGGDAVKVLTWYRPDAPAVVNQAQQDFTKRIGEACAKFDLPYVFELLVYPLAGDADQTRDYVEMGGKVPDHVLRSVEEFAKPEYLVDLFKLESPVGANAVPGVGNAGWEDMQRYFDELGQLAGRPWVMLSAGAQMEPFANILTHAYREGASGYLAGRAIWADAFKAFPDWDHIRKRLPSEAWVFMDSINTMTDESALPWHQHAVYGAAPDVAPGDASFRAVFPGFGG